MIMPNYNGEKFINKAISAFLDSDWPDKELIVVDGKSTDSSHSIIKDFSENNECVVWIQENDFGISDAINIGLRYCNGDVIGYLGSDDLILKDTLSKVMVYKRLVDFDGIYFDSYTYDLESNTIINRTCPNLEFTKINLLRFGTIVGLQNMFFSSRVYMDFDYDVENKYSMDYEFYLRVLSRYNNFIHVRSPSSINISHANISNILAEKQGEEAFKVAKNHVSSFKDFCALYFSKRKLKSYF
jgi:glycosyltransferase involved in cell wall biosynthesis